MTIPLPRAHAVAQMLGELIGRDVDGRGAAALRLDPKQHPVAAYQDVDKQLRAVAYCDIPVGASLGAALVVIPAARVDDCTAAKKLDSGLSENLYEVFNVLSAIFPQTGGPRLILRAMHNDGSLPEDVAAMLAKPAQRLDLDVDVEGYQSGKLAIVTA